ncbi:MAG TPA: S8/S53 family peptidase [Ferruginibacter sp.]|nr:S8/S53 family peptidase [Ferruginibacter sp.]HRE62588.1 S8/S53 family peptidase [Ferruginibacter sp.]
MKRYFSIALATAIFLAGCKKMSDQPMDQLPIPELMSTETIDAFILQKLEAENKFEWSSASSQLIWSALQQSDNWLSVGYAPENKTNIDNSIHQINIQLPEWKLAKEALIKKIIASEQQLDKTLTKEQIVMVEDETLPFINVIVKNHATVVMLQKSKTVRYAEPMAYEPKQAIQPDSDSGCGSNTAEGGLVSGVDYTTIAPNTKQSWNYSYHQIPQAWTKSTGAGIKIFIIDTGSEYDQENLGSAFNQGSSSGRTVEKIVTLPRSTFLGFPTGPVETPDDGCGHGTSMAGAATAPRGTDGAAVGVAYNANLVTCRAASDVLIDASREVTGVTNAYKNAANRTDVKIISMSMGRITGSSQITDAINYAYGKGKLMFCAAGTSFGWTAGWYGVIYPAWLSNVNAVTGVRDNNFNQNCTACHKGSETDFTIVMEKASNERHPLSLAMSGNAPSTVGGSSVATATTAGIAALVWSRFPSYSREQVLNKMITTSSNYPSKSSSFGWGNLNANAATN